VPSCAPGQRMSALHYRSLKSPVGPLICQLGPGLNGPTAPTNVTLVGHPQPDRRRAVLALPEDRYGRPRRSLPDPSDASSGRDCSRPSDVRHPCVTEGRARSAGVPSLAPAMGGEIAPVEPESKSRPRAGRFGTLIGQELDVAQVIGAIRRTRRRYGDCQIESVGIFALADTAGATLCRRARAAIRATVRCVVARPTVDVS